MVIAFGGHYRFPGLLEISMFEIQHMKPKSIPKQALKWIEQLFCWLRQHFMFLSCCIDLDAFSFMFLSFACIFLSLCIHFLSLSFHVSFIGIHFHSCSFHIPFIFIPMCIHVLSSSFHLHACSFRFAFMSFHFLSKLMEMAQRLGQGTECNKWLSLKLSLNNPFNM